MALKVFTPYGGPRRPAPQFYVPPDDEEPPPPPPGDLFWPPPNLSNPVIINLTTGVNQVAQPSLQANTDYIIRMPNNPIRRLNLFGGRNIIVQGGEIDVPWQGDSAGITARIGLRFSNITGIAHVEGLWIHGDDITEGIWSYAPDAIIQLENIRVDNVHSRDPPEFDDNHSDIFQTDGNALEIRIDHFTGWSDYQGLYFNNNFPSGSLHCPVHLKNVNLWGSEHYHRYLLWFESNFRTQPVTSTLDNVWVRARSNDILPSSGGELFDGYPDERSFGKTVWPDVDDSSGSPTFGYDSTGYYADFGGSDRNVVGKAYMCPNFEGVPPNGHFVTPGVNCGIGYVSPWGNL